MTYLKAFVAIFFVLLASESFASSLSDFTPTKIKENLNDLQLTIEAKMVGKVSAVKFTNKESIPVSCSVTFIDGPSPASTRRTTIAANGSKILHKAFGRSLIGLRLNVNCQKKIG